MSHQNDMIDATLRYVCNPHASKQGPCWHLEQMVRLVSEIERLQWLLDRLAGDAPQAPLSFQVGAWTYGVRVCQGRLAVEGEPVLAVTFERTIHLSGELAARDRLHALIDQLRILHQRHYGQMTDEAVVTFTAHVMEQLNRQGGFTALLSLAATAPLGRRKSVPPLRCLGCGKGYQSRRGLARHLRDVHGCTEDEARQEVQEQVDAWAAPPGSMSC